MREIGKLDVDHHAAAGNQGGLSRCNLNGHLIRAGCRSYAGYAEKRQKQGKSQKSSRRLS
ncbi:hypothetical protein D3C81_1116540 [compost metagenome]